MLALRMTEDLSADPPERPMLARVADSLYWMSRYGERCEHIARVLNTAGNLLADVGDLAPDLHERQWGEVLRVFHIDELPEDYHPELPMGERVVRRMTFDPTLPGSILDCVRRSRENARAIRDNISAEMYEALNTLYWDMRGPAVEEFASSPEAFYDRVTNFGLLFQGLCDQTLFHDQRWQFTQVAKWFERVDVTCRILEGRFEAGPSRFNIAAETLRNIHWMSVLRMCCGLEAYRRHHPSDLDPLRIATFLILGRQFPRGVRFGVERALESVHAIRAVTRGGETDQARVAAASAERVLGRLAAQLEYAQMSELLDEGLPHYLADIRHNVRDAAIAVSQAYFLR
jgi:uncharacterized alpha-E superfamily protein